MARRDLQRSLGPAPCTRQERQLGSGDSSKVPSSLLLKTSQQGHSSREVDRTFERATWIPHEELLQYRRKTPTNRTPLVMTYHPSLEPIRKILKKLQPILEKDPILKKIFPEPPILAFRQAPNLANLITRSKLPQPQNTPKGSRPCHDKKSKTCPHISTTSTITTPHNRAISIPGSYSCTSRNVVYLIQCTKCPDGRYVGETRQQLRTRMNAHRKSIKDRNTQLPVGAHFSQEGHSLSNLSPDPQGKFTQHFPETSL
ncbi:uncharacterized protein LOC132246577 [Alligator mississippiensis]|uniref:uncharacterized protein LOC132246577 n=1 Tax=Alligator mississippiensis TaxID=8496 RepID=UPI002877D159|nr:uncharacterized protein LOC132246577 [Alligator mississippiensis]